MSLRVDAVEVDRFRLTGTNFESALNFLGKRVNVNQNEFLEHEMPISIANVSRFSAVVFLGGTPL